MKSPSKVYRVRTKKLVNNVFYHLCPSRLALQEYISGIQLLIVLSLQIASWIFSDLYMPTFVGKKISIYGVTFLENHWIYAFLLMPQSPHSKLLVEFFENVSLKTEGVEEAMICSVKIRSENIRMTWNSSLFPFGMIAIFLNVMALQYCK